MEGDLGAPNASARGERSPLPGSSWVAAVLCFIIALTAAGNSLLIALIASQRALRSTSNAFLVSLFASDLLVGLVVMPPAMLNQLYGRWVLWGDLCSLWAAFDVMCCSASILNLCLISLDRYLLIICPLKYQLRMTPGRALCLILATWTVAALASFLPIEMGWHELEPAPRPPHATSRRDEGQCRLLVSLPYALAASGLTFVLPSAAISFTSCRILLAARRQALRVASLASTAAAAPEAPAQALQQRVPLSPGGPQGSRAPVPRAPSAEGGRLLGKHSKKALKASLTLGILLGTFFVAWLPFFVANVAQAVCGCVPAGCFDVLTWLGYCNSTVNPVIYPLFMRDFRRAVGRYLPCCRRPRPPRPRALSLSTRNSNSGPRAPASLRDALALPAGSESGGSRPRGLSGREAALGSPAGHRGAAGAPGAASEGSSAASSSETSPLPR